MDPDLCVREIFLLTQYGRKAFADDLFSHRRQPFFKAQDGAQSQQVQACGDQESRLVLPGDPADLSHHGRADGPCQGKSDKHDPIIYAVMG